MNNQLDLSIQSAEKYLTTEKRIEDLLSDHVLIEQKTDGIKLTIVKQANEGKLSDYIFAYKGNILYSTEYDYHPYGKIKDEAIGASQFKLIHQHFNEKVQKNCIPIGTELFVEFLMNKPTLSSNYTKKHKMILIGYAPCTPEIKFGMLKTNPQDMEVLYREQYARALKIDVPVRLFEGTLASPETFSKGIVNSKLRIQFRRVNNACTMPWDKKAVLLNEIKGLFLSIDSKYGGTEEGVVIKYSGQVLKWQQDYQLDQEARMWIKQKFREDDFDKETQYWEHVKTCALQIASDIVIKSRELDDLLSEVSTELKYLKLKFTHGKKTPAMIKDDIQLNTKMLIVKKLQGNNNAIIIGKFRILTKHGHVELIKRAQELYDNVVITIVTSKDTKDTKDLREKMIRKTFPDVQIMHASNGNLIRILQKSPININAVYAGTDRVSGYTEQLKNSVGMSVKELPRKEIDISASKVLNNIHDRMYYIQHTPKEIHELYGEIKGRMNDKIGATG